MAAAWAIPSPPSRSLRRGRTPAGSAPLRGSTEAFWRWRFLYIPKAVSPPSNWS